jgi:pilus assembly protein Flp/PilA
MLSNLRKVMRDTKDRGASAVEYGLMVAAIAAVIVGIVFGLGQLVGNTFNGTCTAISSQGATPASPAAKPAVDACQKAGGGQ